MVSPVLRHLSLFLVMVLVTGWFWVLPQPAEAQGTAATDPLHPERFKEIPESSAALCTSTTATFLKADTEFFANARVGSTAPSYKNICFKTSGKQIIHRFQVESKNYEQSYQLATVNDASFPPVYVGCHGIKGTCKNGVPSKYNALAFYDLGSVANSTISTEPVIEYTIDTYELAELYTVTNSSINGGADVYLVVSKTHNYVYGFWQPNRTRLAAFRAHDPKTHPSDAWDANRRKLERNKDIDNQDLKPVDSSTGLNTRQPAVSYQGKPMFFYYIGSVNGVASTSNPLPPHTLVTGSGTSSTGTSGTSSGTAAVSQEKFNRTLEGVRTVFKTVTNTKETSLSANDDGDGGGDIDLIDDPANASEDYLAKSTAPVVRIAAAKLGLPPGKDLYFKLKHTLHSSGTQSQRNNNYFLFTPHNITDEQRQLFVNNGIDSSIVYLVIDAGGNIGILVEDTSKKGGIFGQGKDRFDPDPANNLIALGNFDGNAYGVSRNPNASATGNQPFVINLKQYKKIITKRVYNDLGETSGNFCKGNENVEDQIHFGEVNTGYDSSSYLLSHSEGIPLGEYRKCLHIGDQNEQHDPPGWLTKWGVYDKKQDVFNEPDECVAMFKAGWWAKNTIIRPICGMLGFTAGLSIWLARFAITFLIEAIGLEREGV